jgi:hypothetical protein
MNIFLNLIIILFSYSCKIIQSKPMISSNNTAKFQISSHLFLKQFFQISNEQMIQSGLDPNADMSKFNPLNLNANQTSQFQVLNRGTCYKDSYTRGAGSGVSYCNETTDDKDGSLCYSKCKKGYNGIGPICWEVCKPGFTDRGTFCIIDLDIIGKNCCCIANNSCCNNCPKNYTDDGCTCRRY